MITDSRRGFLKVGGGLLLSLALPDLNNAVAAQGQERGPSVQSGPNPSAYILIASDDTVTFIITKGEMGQGIVTSLSQLLADELDCDWTKVRTEFAPINPTLYGMQGVFGSSSIRTLWTPLRQAGATARAMLLDAAAQQWKTDKTMLLTDSGFVLNPATGARLSYGALSEAAAKLPIPAGVLTKDRKTYKLIGKSIKRLDTCAKVNGTARFGLDVCLPGMVYASIARCPVFGGKVLNFDSAKATSTPGVTNIVQISTGVAVIGQNTWAAMQGRSALNIKFDEGPVAAYSTLDISKMFADRAAQPGIVAKQVGDTSAAINAAHQKLEAVYEVPYLSHATMEPMNCTALVTRLGNKVNSCEIWVSTQVPGDARNTAAEMVGLPPEKVKVHSLLMGGGFGRRGETDYVSEAVEIAKTMPGTPVKLTWTREDDVQHGPYRPAAYVKFAGAVDAEGWPVVLTASVACPSFSDAGRSGAIDHTAVEGIHNMEYAIPNVYVDWRNADPGIPTTNFRGVGYSQNTFFAESFLDELAHAGGKDPLELRRRLLAKSPRLLNVLNVVAGKAGWGNPPPGRHQGVAVVNNIRSFTAQVVEISVINGKLKIHRILCAVDCGHIVNPAIVVQQIEGGIAFGLPAALKGAITIDKGRAQQANFNNYEVLRIDEMPRIETHIVETDNNPGGIGEASVPLVAPALANAIFAATGKRLRKLPIRDIA